MVGLAQPPDKTARAGSVRNANAAVRIACGTRVIPGAARPYHRRMALLGHAALAMWWDMAPAMRAEFEHWHTHEHFPERLGVPGFLRAARWADAEGGDGFFVFYELASRDSLASPEYLARLNDPTPWSRKLMPHHANMVRALSVVLESAGGAIASHALTVRFSPQGDGQQVRESLRPWLAELAGTPGLAGAHLIKSDAPKIAPTEEQRIRGLADAAADWIFIACGYDAQALRALDAPALAGGTRGLYRLQASMVPADAAGVLPKT
jgi:hypothetical protein